MTIFLVLPDHWPWPGFNFVKWNLDHLTRPFDKIEMTHVRISDLGAQGETASHMEKNVLAQLSDIVMISKAVILLEMSVLTTVRILTRIKHQYNLSYCCIMKAKGHLIQLLLSLAGNLSVVSRKSTFSSFSSRSLCKTRLFPEKRHSQIFLQTTLPSCQLYQLLYWTDWISHRDCGQDCKWNWQICQLHLFRNSCNWIFYKLECYRVVGEGRF